MIPFLKSFEGEASFGSLPLLRLTSLTIITTESTTVYCEGARKKERDPIYSTRTRHSTSSREKGKRITVFTIPVYQLDDHATICEELVNQGCVDKRNQDQEAVD